MPVQTFDADATDDQLLARIAAGHKPSLATLYDRYHLLVLGIALRVVRDRGRAEDVVQDAFLAVWRRAGSYAAGRGSVKAWLSSIARHRAIDLVRARRESDADDEAVLLALRDPSPSIVEQLTASLDRDVVHSAVRQLPLDQRRAIAMAYFEGRSHSEISDATGLPLGTVKSRIRLAMQRLRALLLGAALDRVGDEPTVPTLTGPASFSPVAPPSI